MKNFKRIVTLCLCLMLVLSCAATAFAAEVPDATIDMTKKASLTIYTYDWTNAVKDGVWNENSFVSTGWRESYVEQVLGGTVRQGDDNEIPDNTLGNGGNSNGYALAGVEFTIAKVADMVQFTESVEDGHPEYNTTMTLYAFNKVSTASLLKAIGLPDGKGAYVSTTAIANEDLSDDYWYYQSDVLNTALTAAMAQNATTVKTALETYVTSADNAIVMNKTDDNGMTIKTDLELGLYLVCQTKVPEMITSTTNSFFVNLPMATVSGDEKSESVEGGHQWNYDVTVYPKNESGIPSLEKTVREAAMDTGKNNGSSVITDGFAHNATASAGDVVEYQIITTLPAITSKATNLSVYNFYDTIAEGLSYNKDRNDVMIEFFMDPECTDRIVLWEMNGGNFDVSYSDDNRHMTVSITDSGLAEINAPAPGVISQLLSGYSYFTLRLTYTATVNSDNTLVYGQEGNCNEVVLTWKRTSSDYYDTLIDDCHLYSFGIDLTKLFSDVDAQTATDNGLYEHVKFKVWNETDGYWITAALNEAEGVYYVNGHVAQESEATIFNPVTMGEEFGQVMIKGCEDDEYIITEVETANGYTLLKDDIHIVITSADDATRTCDVYSKDVLGVLQNDPHYAFDGGLELVNIPQKQLAHNFLTASATVDGNAVTMLEDNGSVNAEAPLTIVNTRGFDLPKTGDNGTLIFTVSGIILMSGALLLIFMTTRKREKKQAQ